MAERFSNNRHPATKQNLYLHRKKLKFLQHALLDKRIGMMYLPPARFRVFTPAGDFRFKVDLSDILSMQAFV